MFRTLSFATLVAAVSFSAAFADDKASYDITIKEHKFVPDVVKIPADKPFKLVVKNEDKTPEEFESHDFKREKIIGGGSTATINVGPLKPGEYNFFGEFNEATAKGKLIVE